jgi:hypothetical protein
MFKRINSGYLRGYPYRNGRNFALQLQLVALYRIEQFDGP